jgi:hypothetical protein
VNECMLNSHQNQWMGNEKLRIGITYADVEKFSNQFVGIHRFYLSKPYFQFIEMFTHIFQSLREEGGWIKYGKSTIFPLKQHSTHKMRVFDVFVSSLQISANMSSRWVQ